MIFYFVNREYFACGIYRNNLIFSGGRYTTQLNDEANYRDDTNQLIASDTHLFNIRYAL